MTGHGVFNRYTVYGPRYLEAILGHLSVSGIFCAIVITRFPSLCRRCSFLPLYSNSIWWLPEFYVHSEQLVLFCASLVPANWITSIFSSSTCFRTTPNRCCNCTKARIRWAYYWWFSEQYRLELTVFDP